MKKPHLKKHIGYGAQIVAVGVVTGAFAGLVVTLFTVLAAMAEEASRGYYAFFRTHPAFIPLLFFALFLGAVVIGGVLRFLPMIRGSGIPQTEGAMRGLMRFSWYRALTGMFAASLFTVFMGMAAGAEGPSLMIGGMCGCGASDAFKRGALIRRYQITGGACAGLAVAFNAPLTGLLFAFEEGQKRFTPEVFFCAFSSVTVAVLVRNALRPLLGADTGAYFTTFSFSADYTAPLFYAYVLFAALICALAGVGFYALVFLCKRLFGKVTFWKGMGKMLPPFLLAGGAGLLTAYAMGGGHAWIAALGSGSDGVERIFSSPLALTLAIVVLVRCLVTVINMGAGVPCGAFIPMLAIGAGLGALLALLCGEMGMDAAYADALVIICMAAFFTAVVKAPLTGVVMTVELTWNFAFLLPAVLGVAAGYLVGMLFGTKPVYDRLLDEMLSSAPAGVHAYVLRLRVGEETLAAGRAVRDVLLPPDVRITRIERGEVRILPDGNTVLAAGDVLTVEGEARDEREAAEALAQTLGKEEE